MTQKIKIIGVGNDYRSDDAVGLVAVRELKTDSSGNITSLESSGEATSLLQMWGDADVAVIIDAVKSGKPPGTIHRIDTATAPIPDAMTAFSSHSLGVTEAIALQKELRGVLPRIILYGIEGVRFELGGNLSEPVSRSIPRLIAMVRKDIAALVGS